MNANQTSNDPKAGGVGSKEGLGTVKEYAVAVAIDIKLEGKHWYSSPQSWVGMSLFFIAAPDENTAEALGAYKALEYRRRETPGAQISIRGITTREVPNDAGQRGGAKT